MREDSRRRLWGQTMPDMFNTAHSMRLGICLSCVLVVSCGAPQGSPEEAVRGWLTEAVAAAETKDRRGLLGLISESYGDAQGNDRDDINNLLRIYFLRQQNVRIVTNVEKFTLLGDTAAEVSLRAGMAGTNESVLGLTADAYRFEFDLEKDGDEWLLLGARWGGLGRELQ